MKKKSAKKSETQILTINTTIGELIEAITEIALSSGKSEKEGYALAGATLNDILRRQNKEVELHSVH